MSKELLDRKLEDQALTELEERRLGEFLQTFDGKFLLEEKWIEAAENGDERKLEVLLDLRVDVNLETESGLTALTTAAENGYADYVSLLLYRGAYIDQPDENGNTALLLAASNGCTDCLAILLDSGADIYIRDIGGRTALDLAQENKDEESIGLLMVYYSQIPYGSWC